jgi:hypothetical protein
VSRKTYPFEPSASGKSERERLRLSFRGTQEKLIEVPHSAFRFEPPCDNFRIVGNAEVIRASVSASLAVQKRACGKSSNGPTSGLISISSLISHGALMSIGSPSGSSSGCSGSFLSLGRETIKYSWHSLFRKFYTRDCKSRGAQGAHLS